jgi:hypothetical protein
MKPKGILRLTEDQRQALKSHLFPGDGNEAVALALCGRLQTGSEEILCLHEILPIEHGICSRRTPDAVVWPPDAGRQLFEKAAAKSMAIVKFHSHPGYYPRFSEQDDSSDLELLTSMHHWCDDGLSHGSVVMLPDGSLFGRTLSLQEGLVPLRRISVVGDDLIFYDNGKPIGFDESQRRTMQAFGEQTTSRLRSLRIGIVGCSGTGGWVIEQLARLGVGFLVIVDPKPVERRNINRIVGTTDSDVKHRRPKVLALAEHVRSLGTGTVVEGLEGTLFEESIARKIASCDIVFGCMDSVEGRDRLNRLATFYSLPYIDLGVRLDSDGEGGISNVCGNVNYLIPGGSSLLSRSCYSPESLRVDQLRRRDPKQFQSEMEEGYIKGVKVESPAVISVNGFCATMAINELLARLHPFRCEPSSGQRRQQFDLRNSYWIQLDDTVPCKVLARFAGRGDMQPFLNSIGDD